MKPKLLTTWITLSWIGIAALLSIQPALAQKAPSRSLESFKEDLPRSFQEYMQRSEDADAKKLRSLQEEFQHDAADRFPNLQRQQQMQEAAAKLRAQQRQRFQGQNIDAAVTKFRAQQQQRFQGQSQPLLPGAPTP